MLSLTNMECVIAFSVYSESELVDGTQKVLIHLVANDEIIIVQ